MKKFEAKTLENAYALATKEFNCSITELDCEIVQYPSSGLLGFFSKKAIIVVASKYNNASKQSIPKSKTTKKQHPEAKPRKETRPESKKNNKIADNSIEEKINLTKNTIVDNFFDAENVLENTEETSSGVINNIPLQEEIEAKLKSLIDMSCFGIDVLEVDVIGDTAYVFIDGEDAALLIGKEGYRYNALSYLISNWVQNKHDLYLKLEIAQFLASQQEMIRSYMEPVIEHVEEQGWGRTRALDGILVQIALEQLRETFPNKYVAIKRTRNGDRYVLINEFNKR